jgi:competence protein ComEC
MTKIHFIFITALVVALILRIGLFYSQKTEYKDGQWVSFTTTVSSDPKFFGNMQNFSVNLPSGEIVFVQSVGYPEHTYGEVMLVSGKLKVKLLSGNHSILTLSFPKIESVKNSENYFLAVINSIRQKIIADFQNVLPKDSAALLLGIVFGIKVDFSKTFLQNIKTVGVMHVIAASGMNVTMVGGFFFYIFTQFLKRQWAILLSISGIIFYDFLAGFQSSIVRASIMAAIAFSAQIFGKQRDGLYALALTALVMLFWQPNYLTDVGFQLSFASTLGILVIPRFFKRFENGLTADLITTFSAQIATLPILVSGFGVYSLWSVVVNALVLWTVPILMILGGFAAIIAFIFEPLAKLLLYLCLPFLLFFEFICNFFANLKGSLVLQNVPWQLVAAYYLILVSVLAFGFQKRRNNNA